MNFHSLSIRQKQIPTGSPALVSRKGLLASVLLGLMLGWQPMVYGQSDDFDDGNDTGWQKLDLTAAGRPASFTFPDDGTGGKAYRIRANAPTVDSVGPARAFSYQSPDFTRFMAAVDLLAWDGAVDHAFGILARGSNIGLGSTDGYVMNYNSADGDLQINTVTGENPTTIAEVAVQLNPTADKYRWVFSGYNDRLLGQVFALPDTNNPVASVVANDASYASGKSGIFVFNREGSALWTAPDSYADATFDNYFASAPATGSLRASVVELSPRPKERATAIPGSVKIAILDRETTVNTNSLVLTVDGNAIAGSNLTVTADVTVPNNPSPFPGVTITYPLTNLGSLTGLHTNRIVFQDSAGGTQTNEWTFSYAVLRGTNSTPPGSGINPGFSVRLVQASVTTANNLSRAEQQLGTNPPANYATFTTNALASVVNYTQRNTNDAGYVPDGYFANELNFPGIDPSAQPDPNDLAMEIRAYLDLPAGVHTFGVRSDDGFQLSSGRSFTDLDPLVLGVKTSGTFDGTFDFVVEQAGVYPFRLLWFERGGGAHIELFSVNRSTGERTLINDPSVAGSIKAFLVAFDDSVVVESAAVLGTPGSFVEDTAAVVDKAKRTITIPMSGTQKFYRLHSPTLLPMIQSIQIVGNNVVLSYTVIF